MPEKDFEVIKRKLEIGSGYYIGPVEKLTDEARFTEDLNVDR